jgi:hypothetical protein
MIKLDINFRFSTILFITAARTELLYNSLFQQKYVQQCRQMPNSNKKLTQSVSMLSGINYLRLKI